MGFCNAIEDFSEQKRVKLFERIALFAGVMGIVHFFPDLLNDTPEAPVIDLFISAIMFSLYILHKKGFQTTARIVAVFFLNLIFAVYACVLPQEVGVYLFYLPLMAISMAIFGTHQRLYRISFVILSALLLASLFITDFDLIGPFQIESANENTFFLINIFSSAFILVVCINFIIGVNEESERRLHTLAKEVKIKNDNLEKTNAELDRFLYSTSHDLRSPLLSIMGLVNIARNETADSVARKYLTMMEDRAIRLDLFIKDIIDYSRNTRTGVNREIFNVHQLIDEVRQNFQFLDGASNINFQDEISVNEVFADRSRLAVVLNNLISNAIKYHRIDRTIPWVKISIYHSDNKLIIVVADNGQGIHADRVNKIFDMFYRGTERSQGSGLGLYIVKEAVEKMSGTIRVESIEHEGTTFYITIPLNAQENAVTQESEITPQLELSSNSTFVAIAV